MSNGVDHIKVADLPEFDAAQHLTTDEAIAVFLADAEEPAMLNLSLMHGKSRSGPESSIIISVDVRIGLGSS